MGSKKGRLFVLMGVSGCGKTSIGKALHERLGAEFIDADDHHPASNTSKMKSGRSLSDEDRWPWLDEVADAMCKSEEFIVVTACSALKKKYRQRLISRAGRPIVFLHLSAKFEEIEARMRSRKEHFMPVELLQQQFDDLEPPSTEESAVTIDVTAEKNEVVSKIVSVITFGD